jgi:precorrin-3B synthase
MSIVRGWCPTAWRPMAAGDGLILRVRPRLARLTAAQAETIAAVARAHGNGLIDLTNRAALQLRGMREADWPVALAALVAAGLVDPDPVREARALMVAPDWREGDDTHRIACALLDRLDALPPLPGKIGVAIDAGREAVLTDSPADFRIERGATGGLILRADGRAGGYALIPGEEAAALIALAAWFVASGGGEAGRMARHAAPLPDRLAGAASPWSYDSETSAGEYDQTHPPRPSCGIAIGFPFGRIDAAMLADLAGRPGVAGLRVTPWRTVMVEGLDPAGPGLPAFTAADLAVDACVGAPACPQATVATRALALRLAPQVAGRLHVSGCAKGCARATPADVVATGRDGRFDLAFHARAGDPAAIAGLSPDDLIALFESPSRVA